MAISLMTDAVWAAEITVLDEALGTFRTLKIASNTNFLVGGTPAASQFVSGLQQPALAARAAFDDHRTTGRGRTSVGSLVVENPLGLRDVWRTYTWDGGNVMLKLGHAGHEYTSDFVTVLTTTIQNGIAGQDAFTIALRDWSRALEVPVQQTLFAGTNVLPNGIEGTADIAGKPKPVCIGAPRNAEPVRVNTSKSIYQAHDGLLADITTVRDRGEALLPAFKFQSRTSFTAADLYVVAAGNNLVVAGGAVDLTGTPGGALGKSTDGGVTWTDLHNALAFGSNNVTNILWAFSKWIITGSGGGIKTTPDLVTFTARTSGFGVFSIDTICLGDGVVVIMGAGDKVSTTTDGITWSYSPTGLSGAPNWKKCVLFNGRFVALTDDGRVAMSAATDGVTWQWVTPDPFPGLGANRPYQFVASATRITTGAYGSASSPAGLSDSDTGTAWIHRPYSAPPGFLPDSNHTNAMVFGGGIFMQVGHTGAPDAVAGISPDSEIWSFQSLNIGNVIPYGVCRDDAHITFVVVAASGKIASTVSDSFANTTDLQDDTLAPPPGFYKLCLTTGGSYFRLGRAAFGRVTCDPVQGTTAADRTAAQCGVQAMQRASFLASPNLVTNPSALASGWTTSGTCSGTNAVATRAGYSFSRISNASGGDMARTVALTGNTKKVCSFLIIADNVAGLSHCGLFDNITPAWLLRIAYTIAADGTLTAAAEVGELLRVRNLGGGVYRIDGRSTVVNTAHQTSVYANAVSGTVSSTLTSVLMADVYVRDAAVEDDWLTFSIKALDAANSDECGYYTAQGDKVTCGDVLSQFMTSVGAWVDGDGNGVIQMARLENPTPNLVTNPSALNSAPWTGAGTYTNNFAVIDGHAFSRIQGDGSTNVRYQPITLTGNGPKVFAFRCKHRGVTGADVVLLYDGTAPATLAGVSLTYNSDGTITFAIFGHGAGLRSARLPEGSYDVRVLSDAANAAHSHFVYASDVQGALGSGGVTDSLVGDFRVYDTLAVATFDQKTDLDGMIQVPSADENGGIPCHSVVVRYSKNFTPLSGSDLAAGVDSGTRSLLEKDFLESSTTRDVAIATAHPLSTPRIVETLLTTKAAADTEKARLQALHGVQRYWFDAPAFLNDTSAGLPLAAIVDVVSTRYGLGVSARFCALGLRPDALSNRITNALWG